MKIILSEGSPNDHGILRSCGLVFKSRVLFTFSVAIPIVVVYRLDCFNKDGEILRSNPNPENQS